MSCQVNDKNLLLLAHGELDPLRRFVTERHLRRCTECRARTTDLYAASRAMSFGIRGDDLPPWAGPVEKRGWVSQPAPRSERRPRRRGIAFAFAAASPVWVVVILAVLFTTGAAVAYVNIVSRLSAKAVVLAGTAPAGLQGRAHGKRYPAARAAAAAAYTAQIPSGQRRAVPVTSAP